MLPVSRKGRVSRIFLVAAALVAGMALPAFAQIAPGEQGDTQIPFGSTDNRDQAGAGLGGTGGSSMKVDKYGRKNWPCYPAGHWADSKNGHTPKNCKAAQPAQK